MKNKAIMILVSLFMFSVLRADSPSPFISVPCPGQLGFIYEVKIGAETIKLEFALFLPKGYEENKNRKWPMIFYMHGFPDDINPINVIVSQGPSGRALTTPKMAENFPFIVCAPRALRARMWDDNIIKASTSLLKVLEANYRVDSDRVMVTGLSAGGTGTWAALLEAPELFAAAAPMCARPWPVPNAVAENAKNCSVWNIVGGADDPAFINGARLMHSSLLKIGDDTSLTIVPNIGHFVWEFYYGNPEFYHWLLRQVRPSIEMQSQAAAFRKLEDKTNALFSSAPNPNNVASEGNGAVATALNTIGNAGYHANAVINNDRLGIHWGADPETGSGWNSIENSPQGWLQIDFKETQPITEIDVFFVQDNYQAPVNPTPTMTFTLYGLTAFQVQYWTGSAWEDVPGGNVVNNDLVWRKFTFPVINTAKIRIQINASKDSIGRIVEVEAWKPSNLKEVK